MLTRDRSNLRLANNVADMCSPIRIIGRGYEEFDSWPYENKKIITIICIDRSPKSCHDNNVKIIMIYIMDDSMLLET